MCEIQLFLEFPTSLSLHTKTAVENVSSMPRVRPVMVLSLADVVGERLARFLGAAVVKESARNIACRELQQDNTNPKVLSEGFR